MGVGRSEITIILLVPLETKPEYVNKDILDVFARKAITCCSDFSVSFQIHGQKTIM